VTPSDEDLMVLAGRGDRAACATLVERHLGRVVTLAARMLGNRSDAEDAAQEVFLRVWAAATTWRGGSRFTTWLHRVAANVCLDRLAKVRRMPDVPTMEGNEIEIADAAPDPSAEAQAGDVARHVQAALAALPPAQRLAVTLCHCEGLRNIEAAAIMDVSVEALESLLARGRRAMRARLRPIAPALIGTG
jgi:RNA polymerase sigma-70 factor (ECF subfamily)